MGGTNSKKEVKGKTLKNFMSDEMIRAEAMYSGKDAQLLAYERQKSAVNLDSETLK